MSHDRDVPDELFGWECVGCSTKYSGPAMWTDHYCDGPICSDCVRVMESDDDVERDADNNPDLSPPPV